MKNNSKKGGGLIGGLILIAVGVMLLFWNEGRTVSMQSAINEGLKNYKDVSSEQIDPKNEGKLIATTGKLDLSNSAPVKDSTFGITVKGAKLVREVVMYQWIEECTTDDNDQRHCTYSKDWKGDLVDSSEFTNGGHNNPESFQYEDEDFIATNVKVGAFDLPERLLDKLSCNEELNNEKLSQMYTTQVGEYKLVGDHLTNTKVETDPQIGDIRIFYRYATDGEVSLLGVQKGTTLTAFTGKKGSSIYELKRGSYTGKEILNSLTKQNSRVKWIFRIVGTLAVIIGIGSLFAPLELLANKVPVLGKIVSAGTGAVSFVLGLSISLFVIAIAWFRYRPVLSITLLAIIIALLVFLKLKPKKEKSKENKPQEN